MAEVLMLTYVCRWCGAPFSVPTALAENPSVTKRCPTGHQHSDGSTLESDLLDAHRAGDARCAELSRLRAQVASLKGQITKLKAARK